jgi:hypothetical protein
VERKIKVFTTSLQDIYESECEEESLIFNNFTRETLSICMGLSFQEFKGDVQARCS